jgi:hypothetical protein
MFDRGYIVPLRNGNSVESLVDYLFVPKADDIRPVYNGTSSGLNAAVWAPNFWLPTAQSATDVLNFGYSPFDLDLGEMFHNFPLPHIFRAWSGLDLTPFREDLETDHSTLQRFLARWDKCWMGFRPSPYYCIRFFYWAEEFTRGDKREESNPLRWDFVKLNLVGDPNWNPALPRVMKWDKLIDNIAGDIKAFVNDFRCSGVSDERAWAIGQRVASIFQYLGIQNAPRKTKPPVLVTGAWAGSMFSTALGKIEKFVSQKKWDKARTWILHFLTALAEDPDALFNHKEMEQATGFLCHLSMTYEDLAPYLKGFYLSLYHHLPRRNAEGWKMNEKR